MYSLPPLERLRGPKLVASRGVPQRPQRVGTAWVSVFGSRYRSQTTNTIPRCFRIIYFKFVNHIWRYGYQEEQTCSLRSTALLLSRAPEIGLCSHHVETTTRHLPKIGGLSPGRMFPEKTGASLQPGQRQRFAKLRAPLGRSLGTETEVLFAFRATKNIPLSQPGPSSPFFAPRAPGQRPLVSPKGSPPSEAVK